LASGGVLAVISLYTKYSPVKGVPRDPNLGTPTACSANTSDKFLPVKFLPDGHASQCISATEHGTSSRRTGNASDPRRQPPERKPRPLAFTGDFALFIVTSCLQAAGSRGHKDQGTGMQLAMTAAMIAGTSVSLAHSTSVSFTVQ
jgi:hypothetical protein